MQVHDRLRNALVRVVAALRHRLAVDARALAAFRVAVGLLVVADLARRSRNLTAFYTDAGVFPRSAYVSTVGPWRLSVHVVSGEVWFQAALFALAGLCGLALALGYRTTLATVASWLLLVSLHNRHGLVLNGGDFLLRMLLFWGMFLPLGARWSVDSRQARERSGADRPTVVVSVAAAALLCQVVAMYTTNAAMKLGGDVWLRGEALAYVFSLGQFTVLLGDVFPTHPVLLALLDYLWLGMVAGSVLLVAATGVRRVALVAAFAGMHLGMLLTMRLDLFPLISVAALLPFLPGVFWDVAADRVGRHRAVATLGRCQRTLAARLPVVTVSEVPARWRWATARLRTAVPLCFLVLVVLWNLQVLGAEQVTGHDPVPDDVEPVVELTRTDQYWNMFAPNPLSTDTWFVVPASLENGTRVDAFHGGPVRWERPADVSSSYPTARWRKYLNNLRGFDPTHREHFADYLCDRWNRNHATRMTNLSVTVVEQPTRLHADAEPVERVRLRRHRC